MIQLAIGLNAEGVTDYRFVKDIIYRTFEHIIAYECERDIEILDVFNISVDKTTFVETALLASTKGMNELGISVLCVHADADADSMDAVMKNKFIPLFERLNEMSDEECCKIIIPVIPVKMIESWMMADKELLKRNIDARQISDGELGLDKKPETYNDPKEAINKAIVIASQNQRKRMRKLNIASLYEEMGVQMSLEALKQLPSYLAFMDNVRQALRNLNYMH